MGTGYHGPLPDGVKIAKVSSGWYQLLHEVGGSRSPGHYDEEKHSKLCMEEHHLQVRDTKGTRLRQWKTIRQRRILDFCSELGIKNHYSSPAHPQSNSQVEATNRSLLKIIKTRLEGTKGIWPNELPSILWAYRTTTRTPTRETPFRLAYEVDVVIPTEVGLTSYQVENYSEDKNEKALRLQLDLVDEV